MNTQPTMNNPDLDTAVFAFYEAKQAEEQARNHRLACEERVIALVGLKDEGTTSVKTPLYKISTAASIKRDFIKGFEAPCEFRLRVEEMPADGIPPDVLEKIVRYKAEFDPTAFRRLATADPAAYQIACQWVSAKPMKPSVKLEIVQQEEAA